jgi:hypothetical protein
MVLGERNTVKVDPRLVIAEYRFSKPIDCANVGYFVIISKIAVEEIIVPSRTCAEFNWETFLMNPPVMLVNFIRGDEVPFSSFSNRLPIAACSLELDEYSRFSFLLVRYELFGKRE